MPDTFSCTDETFKFEHDDGRTTQRLNTSTKKNFKLNFLCVTPSFETPPAGTGYDTYRSIVTTSGYVQLKRI